MILAALEMAEKKKFLVGKMANHVAYVGVAFQSRASVLINIYMSLVIK